MTIITIRKEVITGQRINGLITRKTNAMDDLQLFANAAAAQAIVNNNTNWLASLTNSCKLKSGKLDKMGKLALDYIRHHCKGLTYSDAKGWKMAKEDKRSMVTASESCQTFALTLAAFESLEKSKVPPAAPKPISAKVLATRLAAIVEQINDAGLIVTDIEQAQTLIDNAYALSILISAQASKQAEKLDKVDTDKAAELGNLKPTAKEKAAKKAKSATK